MTVYLAPLAFAVLFAALGLLWRRKSGAGGCGDCAADCHTLPAPKSSAAGSTAAALSAARSSEVPR